MLIKNVPVPLSPHSVQAEQQEQRPQQEDDIALPRCISEDGQKSSTPVTRASDGLGLRFGKCITFQHVGSVSPTSAHADAGPAPGQALQHCSLRNVLSACTHSTLLCNNFTPPLMLALATGKLCKTTSFCLTLLDSTSSCVFTLSVECNLSSLSADVLLVAKNNH